MEVFSSSDGPSACLVHHASEDTRIEFGEWLRSNNGANIALRLRDGTAVNGRIFRVSMCFGRGLILTRVPIAVRSKEVLKIN